MFLKTMIFIKIVNSIAVKLYVVCDYNITINVLKLIDSENITFPLINLQVKTNSLENAYL